MTICYDVRFPELYRALSERGAELLTVPAAFTLATTRDHWEVLLRARAIENQCFVIAANQIGAHPPGNRSGGRSTIIDPWGVVLATAAGQRVRDRRRPRLHPARRTCARGCPRSHIAATRELYQRAPDAGRMSTAAVDKRRVILDAAVRVFARQGFHTCRVSDIADEAGVAYGLVYHYFPSKETILDTLFLERWDVMLAAIAEAETTDLPPREKLRAIASFIVDSYRHDPDLMKVIIVEVTRAANTFGRTHVDKIMQAYEGIARIVKRAQEEGDVPHRGRRAVRRAGLLRPDRAGAHAVDLQRPAGSAEEFEHVKTEIVEMICGGLDWVEALCIWLNPL